MKAWNLCFEFLDFRQYLLLKIKNQKTETLTPLGIWFLESGKEVTRRKDMTSWGESVFEVFVRKKTQILLVSAGPDCTI